LKTDLLFTDYEKAFHNAQSTLYLIPYPEIQKYSRCVIKGNSRHTHTQNKISIQFNSKLSKLAEINKGVCQGCSLSPTLLNDI
jgi:hypothetical protein